MKQIVTIVILLVSLSTGLAAEVKWHTDFETGAALAKKEKKQIFVEFTGSDWCRPCLVLEKQIFHSPEFEAYAKEHFVLVQLDFPFRKKQTEEVKKKNRAVADRFKVVNYPTVVIVAPDGKVLFHEFGDPKLTPAKYVARFADL